MTKEIKNKKVWRYTRYGFWFMMIGIIFAPIDIETNFEIGFWILVMSLVIFTFVNSIRHLTKYKKKAFAITSLCFSSYYILTFIIGFVIGIVGL